MNKIMSFLFWISLNLVFQQSLVFAQATSGGGGGTMVLIGDQYLLADRFFTQRQRGLELNADAIKYLNEIKALLEVYGITSDSFWKLVIDRKNEYILVDKLPTSCVDLIDIPGQTTIQFACTEKGRTYIIESEFNKLDVQSRMLGLMHERLHAFNESAQGELHFWITDFITSLETMLNILKRQNDGSYVDLTNEEMKIFARLYRRSDQLGFTVKDQYVTQHGGGVLVSSSFFNGVGVNPQIFDNNFVGIGSLLAANKATPHPNKIIRSQVRVSGVINDSEVYDSAVTLSRLDRSKIYSSKVLISSWSDSSSIAMSKVTSSTVLFPVSATVYHCNIDKGSEITLQHNCKNSTLSETKASIFSVEDSTLEKVTSTHRLIVQSGSLSNSQILGNYRGTFTVHRINVKNLNVTQVESAGNYNYSDKEIRLIKNDMDFEPYGAFFIRRILKRTRNFKSENDLYRLKIDAPIGSWGM